MPSPAPVDVAHVAKLARLNLTHEETQLFESQLRRVLEYAEKLREPDTTNVEVAAHEIPFFNVFREDEPRPSLSVDEALRNAPHAPNGLFVVLKVVE